MKTKEELEQIKKKYAELNKKLVELNEEELKQVSGGYDPDDYPRGFRFPEGD